MMVSTNVADRKNRRDAMIQGAWLIWYSNTKNNAPTCAAVFAFPKTLGLKFRKPAIA